MENIKEPDPVLIVEDDRNIAALVERYLAAAGFRTLVAHLYKGMKGEALVM